MNRRLVLLLCTLALVVLAAFGNHFGLFEVREVRPEDSSDIWAHMCLADEINIYALDPSSDQDKYAKGVFSYGRFSYAVIESNKVSNKGDINYVTSMFMRMDAYNNSVEAMCFSPRHGISFNDHWVAVCFECMQYESSLGHGKISSFEIREINDFFENYDVVPLRSPRQKGVFEFLDSEMSSPSMVRRELQKRYFELMNSNSNNGVLRETWVRGDEQVEVSYQVVDEVDSEEVGE